MAPRLQAIARAHTTRLTKLKRQVHAHVYRDGGHFVVRLIVAGKEVDEAGPFCDEWDATAAALRMGDEVYPASVGSAPYSLGQRGSDTAATSINRRRAT